MHFPDTYYVGIKSHISTGMGGEFPLGWPVPDGTDSAAKKRKESVAKWTNEQRFVGYKDPKTGMIGTWVQGAEAVYDTKEGDFKSFDNVPVEGFKFVGDVTRSRDWFGSGASVWRVQDPRGFEFEITSGNLMMLIGLTSIESGVIKGKCLYARDGAKNALLLENSDEYQATLEQTNRNKAAGKFTLKSVMPGDEVILADGNIATYYGKVNCLIESNYTSTDYNTGRGYGYNNRAVRTTVINHHVKERYLLLVTKTKDGSEFKEGLIELPATPKISGVTGKKGRMSLEDAMQKVVSERYYLNGNGSTSGRVVYMSKQKIDVNEIKQSEINFKGSEIFEVVNTKDMNGDPCRLLVMKNETDYSIPLLNRDGNLYAMNEFSVYYMLGYDSEIRKSRKIVMADGSAKHASSLEFRGLHKVAMVGNEMQFREDASTTIMINPYSNGQSRWTSGGWVRDNVGLKVGSPLFFDNFVEEMMKSDFTMKGLNVHGKYVPTYSMR